MKRTGERIIGIVSAVLIGLSMLFIGGMTWLFKVVLRDETTKNEIVQQFMEDPEFDVTYDQAISAINSLSWLTSIGWLFVVILGIALLFTIVGTVYVGQRERVKLAGICFAIAAFVSGVVLLHSILLWVAAGMCFFRKPPTLPIQEPPLT